MKISSYFAEKEKLAQEMARRSAQARLSPATTDAWRAEQHVYGRARIRLERLEAQLLHFASTLSAEQRRELETLVAEASDDMPSASPVQRAQIG